MRVALVHDWLTGMRGGERCLEEFLSIYPEADIYTLLHVPRATSKVIDDRVRGTSFLQSIPGIERRYRKLLPLFPYAASRLKVEGYDLVISLSHAAAKNITVSKGSKHICYCFTPMRYIWDMAPSYFGAKLPMVWPLLKALRWWDQRGAKSVDSFVGISRFVRARIRKYYHRSAAVIYPPIRECWYRSAQDKQKEAFLFVSAFVPYKGAELVIDTFNELGLPLWCIGNGPLKESLRQRANQNITFLDDVSDEQLLESYQKARALVFPAKEDFGMIPIEAMATGTPVIGGYYGALRETIGGVRPWIGEAFDARFHSGVYFNPKEGSHIEQLKSAVTYFLKVEQEIKLEVVVRRSREFHQERFQEMWNTFAELDFSVKAFEAWKRESGVLEQTEQESERDAQAEAAAL